MSRFIKFGWILVREGIISKARQGNILDLQKRHKDKLFGEIASYYFSVPEEDIETAFAEHVLVPFSREWFRKNLQKKFAEDPLDIDSFLGDITIAINSFERHITRSSTHEKNGKKYRLTSGRVKVRLSSVLERIVLHTQAGEIVFTDQPIELEVPDFNLQPVNSQIIREMALRIRQLHKKTQI